MKVTKFHIGYFLFLFCACQKNSAGHDAPSPSKKEKPSIAKKAKSLEESQKKESEIISIDELRNQSSDRFWSSSQAGKKNDNAKLNPPPIRRVDAEHFTVGQFLVNQKEKWIRIKSKVNQQDDILEYLSCGPRGKLHECVLVSFGVPSHLHLALLLLGAEPDSKSGSEVFIEARWTDPNTGEAHRHPAARFLYDRLNLEAGKNVIWHFVGSHFMNGSYEANFEESLVAVINDSAAVIGVKNVVGNAHRGKNQGFEGNSKTTPPVGTPVELYVSVK